MVRLRDVIDFDKIEEVAERVEKKRTLSTMKISEEELEIASQYIKDHERKNGESLSSLAKITGLSWPCLRKIRDKESKYMQTKTYNIFENIINAGLTKKAAEEESKKALEQDIADTEAANKVVAEQAEHSGKSLYELMDTIDKALDEIGKLKGHGYQKLVVKFMGDKLKIDPLAGPDAKPAKLPYHTDEL